MAPVVALGAEEIVVVLVTELAAKVALDRLRAALERNRLARSGVRDYQQVKLYKPIRPGDDSNLVLGSYLYFSKPAMLALRVAGRTAAE